MAEIRRYQHPTIAEFEEASAVCYTRWEYQRALDSKARHVAFQKMGVELAAMIDAQGRMQCVGFLIPASMELDGETLTWYYMFQVASRPGSPGAGALLIRQIMQWYPAIFGMGITTDAEKLYKAFRWQPYEGFWRGVHPVNLSRMVADYGDRLSRPWHRTLLGAVSGIYNVLGSIAEAVLSFGTTGAKWLPSEGRAGVLGSYLPLYEAGRVRAVNVGGAGRLLTSPDAGSLRDHAALWRALRRDNAKFCEMLLFNEVARNRSWKVGYVPLRLPVWCWDKQNVLSRAIPILRARGMTFLETDKGI